MPAADVASRPPSGRSAAVADRRLPRARGRVFARKVEAPRTRAPLRLSANRQRAGMSPSLHLFAWHSGSSELRDYTGRHRPVPRPHTARAGVADRVVHLHRATCYAPPMRGKGSKADVYRAPRDPVASPRPDYRSAQPAARDARAALSVFAIAKAGHLSMALFTLFMVGVGSQQPVITPAAEAIVVLVSTLALLTALIYFLRWVHRLRSNLIALGSDTNTTPAAAIAAYFVPLLNLVRPYKHLREVWNSSVKPSDPRVSPVKLWWLFVLATGLSASCAGEASVNAVLHPNAPSPAGYAMIHHILALAGLWCCAEMIRHLTAEQEQHAATLTPTKPTSKRASRR